MLKLTDEEYRQMTIEDYFEGEVKPNLFAVSRVFAEARKQMTLSEYKTFVYALSNIKWKDKCPDTLYLDKKEVAKLVGINSDIDHLSENLNRSIGKMPKHSFLKFSDKHKGMYLNGNFVRTIAMFKNVVRIRLEEEFLGLFGELESNYITMWSGDVYQMKSERSIAFYELLRNNSDTRLDVNCAELGVKALKDLFDIPKEGKGSYLNKDGHFARTHFEKYVIDPLCDDLKNCRMICLILQADGKAYEKVKKGNKVIAYRFYWTLTTHPAVATAAEVQQIQERVDKDPQVLKVAKDIVNGKPKPKKEKKNTFSNFGERDVDYAELQRVLIENSMNATEEGI